jgi:PDZ domain-containing protein
VQRYLWSCIVTVSAQIGFIAWNLQSPLGAGPGYTVLLLLQYAGILAASAALCLLARAIRREAVGQKAIRGAATVTMGLSAAAAICLLGAIICRVLQSPVEAELYAIGYDAAELTWLALVVLGLAALGTRPRPVLPAVVLGVLFLVGITPEIPLPYTVTGPAGEPDTSYLIRVQGGELHPGRIYGLTLRGGSATAADYLFSLVNAHLILLPEPDQPGMAQEDATLDQMLVDSEAMAKAVGLQLAGRGQGARPSGAGAVVTRIRPGTPAAAVFRPGDLIVGFNGAAVATWDGLVAQLNQVGPGARVTFAVRRDGQPQTLTLTLTTLPNPGAPEKGMVGIQGGDQLTYDLPMPVTTHVPAGVGGPSLGLALTLQVVDQLTPGGITNGWRVAATGQMLPDGKVAAIGGAEYKVRGAERAGAGVIFVPRANYDAAHSGATQIQVVPVDTVQEALAWLQAHPR